MHGRWTYSPNEEAREVGGELSFFFFLLARLAQDFWILFRTFRGVRGRERTLRGVATPTVPQLHPVGLCVQACTSCAEQRCCKIATNHSPVLSTNMSTLLALCSKEWSRVAPIAGGGADHPVWSTSLTATPQGGPLAKRDWQPFPTPPHPHPPVGMRHELKV